MSAVVLIPLIEQALRLVNNLIEGVPVEQRQAQARAWFWLTWPTARKLLKLAKAPDAVLDEIEQVMREGPPST